MSQAQWKLRQRSGLDHAKMFDHVDENQRKDSWAVLERAMPIRFVYIGHQNGAKQLLYARNEKERP